MIKFAEVTKDVVVQLGRFNKDMAKHSGKVGIVTAKTVTKVGKLAHVTRSLCICTILRQC